MLVLRADGDDAYNKWWYGLGGANSVSTILFNDRNGAFDPFVLDRIKKSEVIWFAGGDQNLYENYWTGTPVEDLVNAAIKRGVCVGGTSAGYSFSTSFIV